MSVKTALRAVVITTTQPTIAANVDPPNHIGRLSVPPIIPKPTDRETNTPVNHITKFKSFGFPFPFTIFHLLFLYIIYKNQFK